MVRLSRACASKALWLSYLVIAAACIIGATAPPLLMAQEVSEVSFIGSLEGAAAACAAAYPTDATTYRGALHRLVGCHFTADELRRWHDKMRTIPPARDQYSQGWHLGWNSLSHDPKARREQCMSLMRLACDANTNPLPSLHGAVAPMRK